MIGFFAWCLFPPSEIAVAKKEHPVPAKPNYGAIAGQVYHHRFGLIPKQKVVAKNLTTGQTKTATTDRLGLFRVDELPVGEYEVTALYKTQWGKLCQSVRVGKNSLSVVSLGLDSIRTNVPVSTYDWEGLIFSNFGAFGHLAGIVRDNESKEPVLPNFEILPIDDITYLRLFPTFTRQTGDYFAAWIPAGIYTVSLTLGGFISVKVLGLRIAPDSISILNKGMTTRVLHMEENPFVWKERIIAKKYYDPSKLEKAFFTEVPRPVKRGYGSIAGQVSYRRLRFIDPQVVQTKNLSTGHMKTVTTDRLGLFRIDKLPVGEYQVTTVFQDRWGSSCQEIRVRKDSLSVVNLWLDSILMDFPVTYAWDGPIFSLKNSFGHLAGKVDHEQSDLPMTAVCVMVPYPYYIVNRAVSDSNGHYFLPWIPTGVYTVMPGASLTPTLWQNVRIAPDSISILNLKITLQRNPKSTHDWHEQIVGKDTYQQK